MNNRIISIIIVILIGTPVLSQEKEETIKDSLFFEIGENNLVQYDYDENLYFLKQSTSEERFAFLVRKRDLKIEIPECEIVNITEYIAKFFGEKSRWYSSELTKNLKNYKVFLVDRNGLKSEFIEVYPITIIE